ncbi:glutamine amidotransferase [Planctomicrobium sp. SH661]|uniref:glutamine amidotransferase n=1 Tax=Planctomicrobium sp. SH661 TaxID=3448124 RepID=UPI003F5BCD67
MFESPGWIGFLLLVGGLFLVLLLVSAIRSPVSSGVKWGLFSLKAAAVLLLLLCLLNPMVSRSRAKPGENLVVLLADQSASMGIRQSPGGNITRAEFARSLLDPNQSWRESLSQNFEVRSYTFGTSLERAENFQQLEPQSTSSLLGAALRGVLNRFQDQPLAGILLVTDGNSTDPLPENLEQLGVPIFPVIDDSQAAPFDIGVGKLFVSQTNFEDAPVTVQAAVTLTGESPADVIVSLEPMEGLNSAERLTQSLRVSPGTEGTVRFSVKPSKAGTLFYRLQVRDQSEPEAFQKPESSREATLKNNERWIAVNRDRHVSRILYVGGRPNWEYKFLNRALAEDPQLQLPTLIRIARKEARFEFRGRTGDSSNPLFRGFKSDSDEGTEDYSQPVLIRLNMRDGQELSEGFPKEKSKLFEYDAVILDDVEAAFFTHEQQSLMDRFVAERGGGLLMLGGVDSFRNGKWERTPVADAMPVYFNRTEETPVGPLRWKLSKEGRLESWMRLRQTEQAEEDRIRELPELAVMNPVTQIKPGASLLAELRDRNGDMVPAVVVQRYGQGRSGALLVGDLWKWSLHASESSQDDLAKGWRQLARWLVGDVPRRLAVTLGDSDHEGTLAKSIEVRVRDREFLPSETRQVTVNVTQPDGTQVELETQLSSEEPGLYQSQYVPRLPGAYVAEVMVAADEGDPQLTSAVGWASDPTADEFASPRVNLPLLRELAEKTGGKLIAPDQMDAFVSNFQKRDLPVMETETVPLWHRPWLLAIVVGLLAGEWGIRRWKGLA